MVTEVVVLEDLSVTLDVTFAIKGGVFNVPEIKRVKFKRE